MAKKTKARLQCGACGTKLRKSWGGCPMCGRPRLVRDQAGKAVGMTAFLAKGGGVRCGNCGAASRPGATYCTSCGRVALSVVKSDFEARRDDLLDRIRSEVKPEYREGWQQQLSKMQGGAS